MGQPSAFARRPSEEAPERVAPRTPELVGSVFKPSKFRFDRDYTFMRMEKEMHRLDEEKRLLKKVGL